MIEAGEHRDENRKPLKAEIAEVEARLSRRWAETRIHAAAVGDDVRAKLTSPYTLLGAAGVGFGIAWYYQQREPRPKEREPREERRQSESEEGPSMMTTLLNGLNLAGMVISLFPTNATSGSGETENDPR
jgi:hypothetical protein